VLAVIGLACDPLLAAQQIYSQAVYVIGDSITWMSANQIKADLPGRDVIVQAYPGVTAPQAFPWLVGQGPAVAPNIVIALGSNDGVVPAPFGPQIDQYMQYIDRLAHASKVWWVNVSTVANPAYSAVNSAIAQATRRYSNLRVIDWASYTDSHPTVLYDGVHPDAEGVAVRAAMIRDAVVNG
jgi:lysophospholipase L1-like esterase